jgi:phage-related baseplate assembly protein
MSATTSTAAAIAGLPPPVFINDGIGTDPNLVLGAMIAEFESTTGRTLYPAQVEQLLINLYAYREALLRTQIQAVAQSLLLAFAPYPILDYLAQLVSVSRDGSQPATTNLEFTLTGALTVPLTLPATSTQVGTTDGAFIFALSQPLTFSAGQTVGNAQGTCTTPGAVGNGYVAGQVSVLIGGNALLASVTNTTTTADGSDPETDTHLRAKTQLAPNKFSVAGPTGAYQFLTISADASIQTAQVVTPVPGTVQIYVLCGPVAVQPAASPNMIGIASSGILAKVLAACAPATARPLCDTVLADAVTEVDYTITATVTLFADAASSATEGAAQAAAVQLAVDLANAVGADLVPSQWVAALSVPGVYEAVVTIAANIGGSPIGNQSDGRVVLTTGQWPNCTAIALTFATSTENSPT